MQVKPKRSRSVPIYFFSFYNLIHWHWKHLWDVLQSTLLQSAVSGQLNASQIKASQKCSIFIFFIFTVWFTDTWNTYGMPCHKLYYNKQSVCSWMQVKSKRPRSVPILFFIFCSLIHRHLKHLWDVLQSTLLQSAVSGKFNASQVKASQKCSIFIY